MGITISDFNTKLSEAQKAVSYRETVMESVRQILNICGEQKLPKDIMNNIRDLVNTAIVAANYQDTALQSYIQLLNSISMNSTITWPPTCMSASDPQKKER